MIVGGKCLLLWNLYSILLTFLIFIFFSSIPLISRFFVLQNGSSVPGVPGIPTFFVWSGIPKKVQTVGSPNPDGDSTTCLLFRPWRGCFLNTTTVLLSSFDAGPLDSVLENGWSSRFTRSLRVHNVYFRGPYTSIHCRWVASTTITVRDEVRGMY